MRKLVGLALSAAIAAGPLQSVVAHADSNEADALFERGRKLMKAGAFAEACVAFQQSIDEEPSTGAFLNLGACNDKQRKLNSAKRAFELGLRSARKKKDSDRITYAKEQLKLLSERISFLSIVIEDGFASDDGDIAVFLGGVEIAHNKLNKPIPVDIGLQVVIATVNGEQEFSADVRVTDEGETVEIEVRRKPKPAPITSDPDPGRDEPERFVTERGSVVPSLVALGGSAAAASVGTLFALSARSRWKDAQQCRTSGCSLDDLALADSANFRGDLATGFFIAAGAGTAVAVWLYLRRPTRQMRETETIAVGFSPRSIFVSTSF